MDNREKWRKLVVKSSVVPHYPRGSGISEDEGDQSYQLPFFSKRTFEGKSEPKHTTVSKFTVQLYRQV